MPTIEEAIASVNRVWREFKRYTGDGLPGEPTNAPLPVGDPSTSVHHPKKSELRSMMTTALQAVQDARDDIAEGAVPDNGVSTAKLQAEAVTSEKVADTFKSELVGYATTLDEIAATPSQQYQAMVLNDPAKGGYFVWRSGDHSAEVSADPARGVYVPSELDPTGASGCWVRVLYGDILAEWFGLSEAGTAVTNTLAINRAINLADLLGRGVALPGIECDIDAGVGGGIVVKTNTHLYGQGMKKTILNLRGGGTLAQLRNYQAGSGIRRDFALDGTSKPRVTNVLVEHLAVVMNHPLASITTTDIQIGIDFRSIGRSTVRECWIGNYHPITDHKGGGRTYLCQGYAWVTGNESGGADYAGGEVNTLQRNRINGAYRVVCIDDNQLTPVSAAYSQRVIENDIAIGQILIYQGSPYGAGNVTRDNILQSTHVREGNPDTITACIYWTGYGNMSEEPYVEAGSTCTYILRFGGSAVRNRAKFSATVSATGGVTAAFSDAAGGSSGNVVEFFADTGTYGANSHDSQGSPQRMVSGTTTTVT